MFAIDTNLMVYAHNTASPYHKIAKQFAERIMNERDAEGQLLVCLPAQVLTEFIHVITWQHLEAPISLEDALQIVQDYLDTGIKIIFQQDTYVNGITIDQGLAGRKNLLLACQIGFESSPSERNFVMMIDHLTGTEIWRSPDLIGSVSSNSMVFRDINKEYQL